MTGFFDAVIYVLAMTSFFLLLPTIAYTTYKTIGEDLFHPLIFVNGAITYFAIVPAIYLLLTNNHHHAYSQSTIAICMAVIFITIFYGCILGGFLLVRDTPRGVHTIQHHISTIRRNRFTISPYTGLLTILGGALSYGYYIYINGTFIQVLTVPRLSFQAVPNTGRWKILALGLSLTGLLLMWVSYRSCIERGDMSHRQWSLLLSGSVVAFFLVGLTRARMLIVFPLACITVYFYTANKFSTVQIITAVGAIGMTGLLFSSIEHLWITGTLGQSFFNTLIHTIRFENFVGLIQRVPTQYPYQYGYTFLPGLTQGLIPWTQAMEIILLGHNIPGHATGAVSFGELYINFGIVGLVVGGLCLGLSFGWVYRLYTHVERTHAYVRGLYPFVLVTMALTLASSLTWALQALWGRIVPLMIVIVGGSWYIQRRLQKRHRPTYHRTTNND